MVAIYAEQKVPVAASQTDAPLSPESGGGGAVSDLLMGLLVVPATTSPGAVAIQDGDGTAITVFAGGSSSVASLIPFFVPIYARSVNGAWSVTTGEDVSVVALGTFT